MKMKKQFNLKIYALSLTVMLALGSCSDLEIEGTDSIIKGALIFEGVANPAEALAAVYGGTFGMLGDQANFFALNEVTTDQTLVPTRGSDWSDNGNWRVLHSHSWKKDHSFLITVWNQLNERVFKATEIIDPLSASSALQIAEAKFLRAFNMYFVLDLWGQAPFRNATDAANIDPIVMNASEAYAFILSDINEAISSLPTVGPSTQTNRASKAAAYFLKAKVILNSERYTGTTPNYNDVISAVDAIAGDGFALQAGYFELFEPSVDNETIWYGEIGIGNRIWDGLHYNQFTAGNTGGGWNGFTTLAEFYDLFEGPNTNNLGDGQEERRGWVPDAVTASAQNSGIGYGMLIGQQYDVSGNKLKDRVGNDLIFTKEQSLTNSNESQGVRVIKYHPFDGSDPNQSFRSHEIIFRYADAHLMKAEAMMRNGGSATALVNELRTLRGASTLGSVSESDLIDERGRELYVEYWRRNDLLRFNQFTKNWEHKNSEEIGNTTRNLFPIPLDAIISNPNLVQNPGY